MVEGQDNVVFHLRDKRKPRVAQRFAQALSFLEVSIPTANSLLGLNSNILYQFQAVHLETVTISDSRSTGLNYASLLCLNDYSVRGASSMHNTI